jgi:hypothetical protein
MTTLLLSLLLLSLFACITNGWQFSVVLDKQLLLSCLISNTHFTSMSGVDRSFILGIPIAPLEVSCLLVLRFFILLDLALLAFAFLFVAALIALPLLLLLLVVALTTAGSAEECIAAIGCTRMDLVAGGPIYVPYVLWSWVDG